MNPQLIALYSPVMQSGKTEVATVLCQERGFKLVKFADGLKTMIRTLLGMTGASEVTIERMLEGDLKERVIPGLGVSTRHLMQSLGTDWGRNLVNENLWVALTRKRLQEHLAAGHSVVIDDMRHGNEYDLVVALGGECVKVLREGAPTYSSHKSEGLLDSVPMLTLVNSGTLERLHATARALPDLLQG